MRNKLLLGLVLTAATSSVFAMPYDPAKHDALLEIALTGGGFKSSTDSTAYGLFDSVISTIGTFPSGTVLKNDPKYKFGGTVLLGYFFENSTINADLSYTGLRNHLFDSAANSSLITARLLPFNPGGSGLVSYADSTYHFDYDYGNIEIGSLTRVNSNGLIINPQLGLSYVHIKQNQTVGYAGGDLATTLGTAIMNTRFNGFGPSFGIDLNFIVCQPVTFSGNFRYNALVGNVHSLSRFFTSDGAGDEFATLSSRSHDTLVSLFQTELALGYDFNIADMFCGNLAIGYQLTKLIDNGEQLFSDSSTVANHPNFQDNMTNNSIHGYFLRLTMDFHV